MSGFDPNSKKNLPTEYWESTADLEISGNGIDHAVIVFSIFLCGFLAMTASWGVGGFMFALILWNRFKSQHDAGRAAQAIADDGLVAPFLKGDNFKQYLASVGEEEVKRQINYAQANQYRLSMDAAVFSKRDLVTKALPPSPEPKALPPVPANEEEPLSHNVGSITRLKSIDVKATPTLNIGSLHPSEHDAMAVLDGLVGTRLSTLWVGGTGAGKSTAQAYKYTKFFEKFPDAEVWAIAQKNDSFFGLNDKGRVILFDLANPGPALNVISKIHGIYNQRRSLPVGRRDNLPPVRLILADWLSINQALEMSNDSTVKDSQYLVKLSDIIFNGREFNVCLDIDLQSFNLAAIGLKADKNSRKNFNLIGLGNYYLDRDGGINESYGVLGNLIGDRFMVADQSEREALKASFDELKAISKLNQRPILFSSLEPARLALLPDLRGFRNADNSIITKPSNNNPNTQEGILDYLEKTYQLEFDVAPKHTSNPESVCEVFKGLSDNAQRLLDFMVKRNKTTMDAGAIGRNVRFKSKLHSTEIRKLMTELVDLGHAEKVGVDSIKLVSATQEESESDTSIDTSDTEKNKQKGLKNSDTEDGIAIPESIPESDTSDTAKPETRSGYTIPSDTGSDTADTRDDTNDTRFYTPAKLSAEQVLLIVNSMKASGSSQTQIIQSLWSVEKNQAGWKLAYNQYKELTGEKEA